MLSGKLEKVNSLIIDDIVYTGIVIMRYGCMGIEE
jgi:hypothetical protein